MKNLFYQLLIWMSGADTLVLEKCSVGEKKRMAGIGALIFIPALTGLISMSYAISMFFSDKIFLCVSIGFIWSLIILSIDRYLVSTFKKLDSMQKEILSGRFILRFIFSIGIGIMVSHPLVIFIFRDTINNELKKTKEKAIDNFNQEFEIHKKNEENKIEEKTKTINTLKNNIIAEAKGDSVTEITTNRKIKPTIAGQGRDWRTDTSLLHQEMAERDRLQIKVDSSIVLYDSKRKRDTSEFISSIKNEYIIRVNTLNQIENRNGNEHIKTARKFLLMFFIFLDILPLLFKVFSDKKEYDYKVEKCEKRRLDVFQYQMTKETDFEIKLATELYEIRNKKMKEAINEIDHLIIDDFLKGIKERFEEIFTFYQKKEQPQEKNNKGEASKEGAGTKNNEEYFEDRTSNERQEDIKKKVEEKENVFSKPTDEIKKEIYEAKIVKETKGSFEKFKSVISFSSWKKTGSDIIVDYKKKILEALFVSLGGMIYGIISGLPIRGVIFSTLSVIFYQIIGSDKVKNIIK